MEKIKQFIASLKKPWEYTEDELCLRFARMKLHHYQLKMDRLQEEIDMLEEKLDAEPLSAFYPLFRASCSECHQKFALWELNVHEGKCLGCLTESVPKSTSRCPFRQ